MGIQIIIWVDGRVGGWMDEWRDKRMVNEWMDE